MNSSGAATQPCSLPNQCQGQPLVAQFSELLAAICEGVVTCCVIDNLVFMHVLTAHASQAQKAQLGVYRSNQLPEVNLVHG